ncbi:MAG: phytanoyl-CoA dioxygenase family protein [Fimbriimonadaceae bacterium]|nr:phytanoyl-CoA dioxygenase family protein [Fimbriimonadaceae bacterium]
MATIPFDTLEDQPYAVDLYRVRHTLTASARLSDYGPAMREQYEALGVLSFSDVLNSDEVAGIGDAFRSLITRTDLPESVQIQYEHAAQGKVDGMTGAERLDYLRKFMLFAHCDSRVSDVMYRPDLMAIVRDLLGGEPEMFQDMALLKPPGIGREKPWHQDHAYFDLPEGTPVVGVWIALDEAVPENGCMHFLLGGHRAGPLPHFNRRDWQLCDSEVLREDRAVAAPLPAGGALIFDGLTPHGTPSNRSDRRRWALQFHYVRRGTPRISREERFEIFGEDRHGLSC